MVDSSSRVRAPVVALGLLVAWTLLVWVGRIRNVLADEDVAGWAKSWRLGVAVAFTVAGIALGVLLLGKVKGSLARDLGDLIRPSLVGNLASLLAVVGIGWWVIRGGGILLADHDAAFKAVHTVLGLVTIGLSSWVLVLVRPLVAVSGR